MMGCDLCGYHALVRALIVRKEIRRNLVPTGVNFLLWASGGSWPAVVESHGKKLEPFSWDALKCADVVALVLKGVRLAGGRETA